MYCYQWLDTTCATIAIFELVRPFDHRMVMMPWKFHDGTSNGSGFIMLTDKQTETETDPTENNTTLAARLIKIASFSGIMIRSEMWCCRQDMEDVVGRLQLSYDVFARAMNTAMSGGTEQALPDFVQHLLLLQRYIRHPWRDLAACQSSVKYCYRYMANVRHWCWHRAVVVVRLCIASWSLVISSRLLELDN